MANSTLTPKNSQDSNRQDDELNPGQAHYNREFGDIAKNYNKSADSTQEDASAEKTRLRDQEEGSGLNKTASKGTTEQKEKSGQWAVNMASTAATATGVKVPFLTKKRGGASGLVIGIIIAMLIGLGALTPFGVFIQLKEVASSWADKFNRSGHHSRMGKVYKARYFNNKTCTGIKCKVMPNSISEKEQAKLKKAGLTPVLDDKGRITAFDFDEGGGKTKRIDAANFSEEYKNNPRLVAALNNATAPPRALTWRGPQALKKLYKLGINRSKVPSNSKEMREQAYGDGRERLRAGTGAVDESTMTEEEKQRAALADSIGQDINSQADELRNGAVNDGIDPSRVPDISAFDPDGARDILDNAGDVGKASLKGAALNAFAVPDSVCTAYRFVKAVTYGAKVYQARDLIKYASIFMIAADAAKTGKITQKQASYIASVLLKPSREKTTKGKTFPDSEGYTLITQGKVTNKAALSRMTNGMPALEFFEDTIRKANTYGAGTGCKHVKSWYGQIGLLLGGLLLSSGQIVGCIVGGAGCAALGATAGAGVAAQIAAAVAMNYMEPLLIAQLAGVSAPDPDKDPLGGYGAGMAIASGMGAFGSTIGRSNAMKPLTKDEYKRVAYETSESSRFLAQVDAISNPGALNSDNNNSPRNKLALALAPLGLAVQTLNVQATISASGTLMASAPTAFLNQLGTAAIPAYAQTEAQTDYYRDELCGDVEYKAMNIATDAFCNPIYGELRSTIDAEVNQPEVTLDWMIDNEYVDQDSGEPKGEYADYLNKCINGVDPLDNDTDSTTLVCVKNDQKYTYFRMYTMDMNISESIDASVDGTLGQQTASAASSDAPAPAPSGNDLASQYENGKIPPEALCELGPEWPGQSLQCPAAEAFKKLNVDYKGRFAKNISVTDSYRSYEDQVRLKAEKGAYAATPGTSNHGWGLALDLGGGINRFGTPEHDWMRQNSSRFGWIHPNWAHDGKGIEEPWHWEFGAP